jgi:hypothetical protein
MGWIDTWALKYPWESNLDGIDFKKMTWTMKNSWRILLPQDIVLETILWKKCYLVWIQKHNTPFFETTFVNVIEKEEENISFYINSDSEGILFFSQEEAEKYFELQKKECIKNAKEQIKKIQQLSINKVDNILVRNNVTSINININSFKVWQKVFAVFYPRRADYDRHLCSRRIAVSPEVIETEIKSVSIWKKWEPLYVLSYESWHHRVIFSNKIDAVAKQKQLLTISVFRKMSRWEPL